MYTGWYMHKPFARGFTLIELLVVIAIIGILAGIVLASLGSARSKGKDAAVASAVRGLKNQMELDYNSASGNYNASFTVSSGVASLLATGAYASIAGNIAGNGVSGSVVGTTNSAAAFNNASGLIIVTNGTGSGAGFSSAVTNYALRGKLSTGKYYCADSTGYSNTAESAPGSGNFATTCS